MKFTYSFLGSIIVLLLFVSCGTTKIDFPVSEIVPAAEIKVAVDQDDNNNYAIELQAQYLAPPSRLSPPRNTYILWAKTAEHGIRNIGQINAETGKKIKFKTTIPYRPIQLFITAEEEPTVEWPSYQEITRTRNFNP